MTVPNPFYDDMLKTLKYPNPPAGVAVILVNTGQEEPAVIHVDLDDGVQRVLTFTDGQITLGDVVQPQVVMSALYSMLPERVPTMFPAVDDLATRARWLRQQPLVMQYLQRGNLKMIQAIKETRSLTNLGLKEAKDLVDYLVRTDNLR